MIVQCISFGSHWYLKKRFDQRTGALLRHRSAFMNTTHIKVGSPEKYKHSIGGFVRINAATKPYFDSPQEILQAKYYTEGVTRYMESNRLMLRSRAPDNAEADRFLVCVRSTSEGMIDFNSDWRCDGSGSHTVFELLRFTPRNVADDEEGIGYLDCSRKLEDHVQGRNVISRPGRRPVTHAGKSLLNPARDLPLLLLIRDATFISRQQLELLIAGRTEEVNYDCRNRRLARLVDLNQIQIYPQCFPYPGRIFAITQAGINTLQVAGMGILSVSADTETLAERRASAALHRAKSDRNCGSESVRYPSVDRRSATEVAKYSGEPPDTKRLRFDRRDCVAVRF